MLTSEKKVLVHVGGKEKRITFATRLKKDERSSGKKKGNQKQEIRIQELQTEPSEVKSEGKKEISSLKIMKQQQPSKKESALEKPD